MQEEAAKAAQLQHECTVLQDAYEEDQATWKEQEALFNKNQELHHQQVQAA